MKKIFILLILFSSCRNYNDQPDQGQMAAKQNEELTEANIRLVKEEAKQIDEFILRHHFQMEMTGTGLRYQIYQKGSGKSSPSIHDLVTFDYRVFLLNGTLCYTTDTLKHQQIRLSEGMETHGLEEGLMLMKEGDRARLVVPAHLAFGLTGDGNRIPPASTLFYDVTLIRIEK